MNFKLNQADLLVSIRLFKYGGVYYFQLRIGIEKEMKEITSNIDREKSIDDFKNLSNGL